MQVTTCRKHNGVHAKQHTIAPHHVNRSSPAPRPPAPYSRMRTFTGRSCMGPSLLVLLSCMFVSAFAADFLSAARELHPWLVSTRRELHKYPELMFDLHNTSAIVRRHLDQLDIPYKYPIAKTGIVGRIGKGKPVVALRADMDALPIQEPPGVDYRSQNDGRMHACGHDAHMTMLLGAAKLLKARESELQGTALLVFQPAEEGGAGGDKMIQEGAIEGASAAFGMHVWPISPTGTLALRSGTIMAASLTLEVFIKGRGGHAAVPHANIDPVPAAAAVVLALQTLVSRETSPLGSAVLSITQLQGSDANNIIPDQVAMGGTLRALTHEHMMYLKGRIEDMVASVAAGYRCNGTVDWHLEDHPYYPPTVNNPGAAAFVQEVATELLGSDKVMETEPVMPAEDFSFFTQAVPSTFMFLGIRNEALDSVHNLHNRNFKIDEDALQYGAALHATIAQRYLQRGQDGFGAAAGSGSSSRDEL